MRHWKTLTSLALCLAMILGLFPAAWAAEDSPVWADGTYEGTGTGFGGDVVMSVTIQDGIITNLEPVSHDGENFWVVYESELNDMIEAIRQKGSTDVDAVSGATKSSNGIKQAVDMALNLASGWEPEPPKPFDPSFFAAGDGSEADPWVIQSRDQLEAFAVSLTEAEGGDYAGKYVRLDSDIDLTGREWIPIGEHQYGFAGSFDGGNHTVTGMTMGSPEAPADAGDREGYWAFFSLLTETARVKDLNLTDVSINASSRVGLSVGGVAGVITNSDNSYDNWKGAVVDHCSVSGVMTALQDPGTVNLLAGGVTSFLYKGAIINCMTDVDLNCTVRNGGGWVEAGGITGMNNRGLVANCFSLGDILGEADQSAEEFYDQGMSIISPLVGFNAGHMATCYEMGSVSSVDNSRGLGLLTAYMTMGGLYDCWYSDTASMTKAGEAVEPAKTIGAQGKVYSEGLYNVDVVVGNVEAYSPNDAAALAEKINAVLPSYPLDLSFHGLSDDCLRSWTVQDGMAVFGDSTVQTPYVRPEADYLYPAMKALEDAIAQAKTRNQTAYTAESWTAMEEALKTAQDILAQFQPPEEGAEPDEAAIAARNEAAEAAAQELNDAVRDLVPLSERGHSSGRRSGSSSAAASVIHSVAVRTTENGALTASTKNAAENARVTLTVKPDEGFRLDQVTVTDSAGTAVPVTAGDNGSYTFSMPARDVTASAAFIKDEPVTLPAPQFTDVPDGAYYSAPVYWAVDKGVTNGTDETHFSPDNPCTRAQMVTFLWRAAGSPQPASADAAFPDVAADSYYAQAVAWAAEQGVVKGTSETTFGPDQTVTRAQSVTLLYRYLGQKTEAGNSFLDVADGAYYFDAVQWAAASGVTNGTSRNTFSPDSPCTRAQIVTFLSRAMDA